MGPDYSALLASVSMGSLITTLLSLGAVVLAVYVVQKGIVFLFRVWLANEHRRNIAFFERGGRDLRNF